MRYEQYLADEIQTVAFGRALGASISATVVINLKGTLGAGKTTFCRGVLSAFGHSGAVKSPTYTLVEPYEYPPWTVYHFDLYRLASPDELEYIGIRDYFHESAVCLIEWPEKSGGLLPNPDLTINITVSGEGRLLVAESGSDAGNEAIKALKQIEV